MILTLLEFMPHDGFTTIMMMTLTTMIQRPDGWGWRLEDDLGDGVDHACLHCVHHFRSRAEEMLECVSFLSFR